MPNAIATFKEYLNDYASEKTKEDAGNFLDGEIDKLDSSIKKKVNKMVERVNSGERDVFF